MFLFELAMELDVRSADMADAAPGLGLEGLTPTSELTAEQVHVLRARFAKVPVMPGPGGPPGGSPYQPPAWGPPPGAAVAPAPRSSGGMGAGQIVLIGIAVVAVLGLFAFMFQNGGTDEKRLDEIAKTEPADDGVPVTGPDGTPLTEEQKFGLAKMEAAQAANQEHACKVLRQVRSSDVMLNKAGINAQNLDQVKAMLIQGANNSIAVLDEAIVALPSQANDLRLIQQFSRDALAMANEVGSIEDLRAGVSRLQGQARSSGAAGAANALNAYAVTTCNFSLEL